MTQEEPYKLSIFGKSRSKMEVVTADFLPFEGALYLIVVDANCDLHVLQYDPERTSTCPCPPSFLFALTLPYPTLPYPTPNQH